jgi:hypothetical protein
MFQGVAEWLGVDTDDELDYCMPNRHKSGSRLFSKKDIFHADDGSTAKVGEVSHSNTTKEASKGLDESRKGPSKKSAIRRQKESGVFPFYSLGHQVGLGWFEHKHPRPIWYM